MTFLFSWFWYHFFAGTMYTYRFYRRGNYVIIGLYALFLIFFGRMYGATKLGQLRRIEVILSQFLSIFISNVVTYIIISLLAFRFINVVPFLVMTLGDFLITTLWYFGSSSLYGHIFKSWKILLIYGERQASDLVYKVEERRDKYAISDAIHVSEGLDKIAKKAKDYEAVIIGDISAQDRNDVLKFCYSNGIRAYVIPKISDIILMGSDRIHIFDTPFLLTKGYSLSFDQEFAKRFLDLVIAIPMLILASPFMLLTAAAIKLYDKGPVFYKQIRCTKNGKPFEIIKFRSMIINAEKEGGAQLAKANDSRITPIGRFIRSTRIDELPQLFNVLKGEMSLVGPRPERPFFVEKFKEEIPRYMIKHQVRPGLTGWAQVNGRNAISWTKKFELDVWYVDHCSFLLDLKIFLLTIRKVFVREGISSDTSATMEPFTGNN